MNEASQGGGGWVTYMPRSGSKGALAMSLLAEGPMLATDLGPALEVESGSLPAILGSVLKHGLIVKVVESNRATYSLPVEDDGKPIRRAVTKPSTAPSAEALALANPFGAATRSHELQPSAAEVAPRPQRMQRLTKLATNDLELVAEPSARFGIFSDGSLVIESGATRIELDPATAHQLHSFLAKAA